MGLLSFMVQDSPTYGSIETSDAYRRKAAIDSLEYNCQNKTFISLFPELVELNEKLKKEKEEKFGSSLLQNTSSGLTSSQEKTQLVESGASWTALLTVLVAIVAFTWALIAYAL